MKTQTRSRHSPRRDEYYNDQRWEEGVADYRTGDDYRRAARGFYNDTPSNQNSAVVETIFRKPKTYADLHEYDGEQVIDRVPTAVGYHSLDSADEIEEEKSRHSRYSIEDDVREQADPEAEEPTPKRDENLSDDDSYDKYAQSMKNSTMQSIWSDDSDSCPPMWKSFSDQEEEHGSDWALEQAKRLRELNSVRIPKRPERKHRDAEHMTPEDALYDEQRIRAIDKRDAKPRRRNVLNTDNYSAQESESSEKSGRGHRYEMASGRGRPVSRHIDDSENKPARSNGDEHYQPASVADKKGGKKPLSAAAKKVRGIKVLLLRGAFEQKSISNKIKSSRHSKEAKSKASTNSPKNTNKKPVRVQEKAGEKPRNTTRRPTSKKELGEETSRQSSNSEELSAQSSRKSNGKQEEIKKLKENPLQSTNGRVERPTSKKEPGGERYRQSSMSEELSRQSSRNSNGKQEEIKKLKKNPLQSTNDRVETVESSNSEERSRQSSRNSIGKQEEIKKLKDNPLQSTNGIVETVDESGSETADLAYKLSSKVSNSTSSLTKQKTIAPIKNNDDLIMAVRGQDDDDDEDSKHESSKGIEEIAQEGTLATKQSHLDGFASFIISGFDSLVNVGFKEPFSFLDWSGEENKISKLETVASVKKVQAAGDEEGTAAGDEEGTLITELRNDEVSNHEETMNLTLSRSDPQEAMSFTLDGSDPRKRKSTPKSKDGNSQGGKESLKSRSAQSEERSSRTERSRGSATEQSIGHAETGSSGERRGREDRASRLETNEVSRAPRRSDDRREREDRASRLENNEVVRAPVLERNQREVRADRDVPQDNAVRGSSRSRSRDGSKRTKGSSRGSREVQSLKLDGQGSTIEDALKEAFKEAFKETEEEGLGSSTTRETISISTIEFPTPTLVKEQQEDDGSISILGLDKRKRKSRIKKHQEEQKPSQDASKAGNRHPKELKKGKPSFIGKFLSRNHKRS